MAAQETTQLAHQLCQAVSAVADAIEAEDQTATREALLAAQYLTDHLWLALAKGYAGILLGQEVA